MLAQLPAKLRKMKLVVKRTVKHPHVTENYDNKKVSKARIRWNCGGMVVEG
jgi:hypothetical protein